jgi:hypothetical protein
VDEPTESEETEEAKSERADEGAPGLRPRAGLADDAVGAGRGGGGAGSLADAATLVLTMLLLVGAKGVGGGFVLPGVAVVVEAVATVLAPGGAAGLGTGKATAATG